MMFSVGKLVQAGKQYPNHINEERESEKLYDEANFSIMEDMTNMGH